jgi:hypothetical protein
MDVIGWASTNFNKMARITTTTRSFQTKETVEEIINKFSHQWIELTEIFYGEKMNGGKVQGAMKVHINKEFIVEMFD